jgi:branched-chain amino acid aminotransferase group I
MEEIVYLNGALMPRSEAKVSALDYGFMYGYGLFETMRAYSGHIFRLRQHLDRLSHAARLLGVALESVETALEKALYDTLEANNLTEARLRLTLSGGEGDASPDLSGAHSPTVLVTAKNYVAPAAQGGRLAVISSIRRNSHSPLSRVKSLNYLDNLLARREAKAAGVDEALLLNEVGLLVEASTSNLFIVSQGALITPDESCGLLPGIARRTVLELAASLGIEARESNLSLEGLLGAEEAFLTNSMIEIAPLIAVGDQRIGSGDAGELTRRLSQRYGELVRAEIGDKK